MRLSLFTPTHNSSFLEDLYRVLKDQPFDEWVIVPNGGLSVLDIPPTIRQDLRVHVFSTDTTGSVGALKRFACERCKGDILVEADHDDLLIAPGLLEVRKAFSKPEVVLAYSNTAEFNDSNRSPREFSAAHGWRYRDYPYEGVRYREAISPGPHPNNSSIIYYSPNHLRAFRRTAYEAVGGYDPKLEVLDDQDLISRLFCVGEFAHIDKCCYLYRVTGQNTWLKRNQDIQDHVMDARRKYLPAMVESWAKRLGLRMLDLGGRFGCPPGYESVDLDGAAIKANLCHEWPFEDNSVGVIRAHDILEHLPDKMFTLHEIHRVLIPGGILLSSTPSTTGPHGEAGQGADQDPTHVSRWNRNSFWYVTRHEQAKYVNNNSIRFLPMVLENGYPNEWCHSNLIPYVRADLVALKKGPDGEELYRPHGLVEI